MRELDGRVALVTGASRGLGAVIAQRLGRAGARVAVAARTLEADPRYQGCLRETVDAVRATGAECEPVVVDLSRAESRENLIADVMARMGPVDVLINNAAVTYLQPSAGFPAKRYDLMLGVQVTAPFHLAQLVFPSMAARGAGWIVNISSRSAVHPPGPPFTSNYTDGGWTVYGMCKAALERMSTGLAAELQADGIAVNSLAPWYPVATPGASELQAVIGDTESPEWIAEAALILASGDPKTLTGRVAHSMPLLAEFSRRPLALAGSIPGEGHQ